MRVLMSAFACEPYKGSEPEVGWQWALQMARFHEVSVLTQSKNRPAIEKALQASGGAEPAPRFLYHSLPKWLQAVRQSSLGLRIYYLLWQRSARQLIRRLCRDQGFDLLHHLTFAAFRYPTAIWGHGVPCIWGPIGGIESIPAPLMPWQHPVSLAHEILRSVSNRVQQSRYHLLARRAGACDLILASTREMQSTLAKLGFESEVMPTIGLKTSVLPYQPHRRADGPLRLLFVGKMLALKGLDLALEALKASQTDATFTLVGSGNYLSAAKRLAQRLALANRVRFEGLLPRERVLEIYPDFDLFLFPSLHDTGGYAVIEAMFNELPVVCLDCGGPAAAVADNCGARVPLGPRQRVIAELAEAIRGYDRDRAALLAHGKNAREFVLNNYDWDKKGARMNECYQRAITRHQTQQQIPGAAPPSRSDGASRLSSSVS